MKRISVFCPATVANVSVGYDVLGFCLESIGDIINVSITPEKGIKITEISGYPLSYSIEENIAGISAMALYKDADPDFGFEIEIHKKIKPGSGIGSSAASATGSVFAINELLGRPYDKKALVEFALEGECYASNSKHADNLAPCIFGGFTLVKDLEPIKIVSLPVPEEITALIIHPQIELKTSDSRSILPETVPLKKAIKQLAEMGSFVHALHSGDLKLLKDSLKDHIAEPYRGKSIPKFDQIKDKAFEAGAIGCGISGSGPSIFALVKDADKERIMKSMLDCYDNEEFEVKSYMSKISKTGLKVID